MTNDEEIDRFEKAVESYFNLQIDPDRFTAIRLQQGCYGQRQDGVNMLRIKIPGGSIKPAQIKAIAEVVDTYSQHDTAHLTTRQSVQIHYVPLQDTPNAMRMLAKSGLTTREACGNTIRNITGCPLAGICPKEHVDISTHVTGAAMHFLRNPLSQQMPRKFKISLSGCEADCAQAMIHDLGLVATEKDGKFGFKVYSGGGLGHKPHEAILIEPFIEENNILIVMEAVVSLHNRYSDRTKRAKSRIKYLVDRFGADGFIEKYREELALTRSALADIPYPQAAWKKGQAGESCGQGAPKGVFAQKQEGLFVFPISLPLGEITSTQLRSLASLLEKFGLSELRSGQNQNLMVLNVPERNIANLRDSLAQIGLYEPKDDIVACPGTSTCRLGITSSMTFGAKLSGKSQLRIRVSGCHNGCAQPETGDIGIYGEGKRLHGKLVPHYQMYFGGNGMGGGAIGLKGPSIPSARIAAAISRVENEFSKEKISFFEWARQKGADYFTKLLSDLNQVSAEEMSSVISDHGMDSEFKVLQLGGGECAGASQVKIGSSFFDAAHERRYRDALFFQRKYEESLKCSETIALLIGQGLIDLLGGKKLDEIDLISNELKTLLPGQLSGDFDELSQNLKGPKESDLPSLFKKIDAWTVSAAQFCQEKDAQLDLSEALP